jgi:hypothetical protein
VKADPLFVDTKAVAGTGVAYPVVIATVGNRKRERAHIAVLRAGMSLGMVMQLPDAADEHSVSQAQLLAKLDVAMGGRVAEELIFGERDVTTGASSDLEQVRSDTTFASGIQGPHMPAVCHQAVMRTSLLRTALSPFAAATAAYGRCARARDHTLLATVSNSSSGMPCFGKSPDCLQTTPLVGSMTTVLMVLTPACCRRPSWRGPW